MSKENLYKGIDTVFGEVIFSLTGTDDKRLNEVPFADSWTIGQVAEHIMLCSRGIPDNNVTHADRPFDAKVAALRAIFLDMDQKSKADLRVTPGVPPHSKKELIPMLETNKVLLLTIISEHDLSELCVDTPFPYLEYLTRYEWLYFIQVHTQRHLNQIKSIQQILSGHN
ncbi:DinB family protein [Niabella aquatica]